MDKLQGFQKMIDEGLKKIPLSGQPSDLYGPLKYILGLGGKRMRPALTLIACDLFDAPPEDALPAALGIELFHNFSLIHDDIMDKAPLRRNQPTIHEKWDGNVAILSGDAMLIKAYQQIAGIRPEFLPAVLEIFNETALMVCEGQQLDMNFEKKEKVTIHDYIRMIEKKTAVLLAASLQIGAIIGKAGAEDSANLYEFGRNMGIAFQLQDDILDVYGDATQFGKRTGGDIISNKKTFLLLKAIELAERMPYKKEELLQWIHAPEFNPIEKVIAVTSIYDYLNIRPIAEEECQKYYQKAISELDKIHTNSEKKVSLHALAKSLMNREM
jgi:geranylgeranyl diphosphate synthase type II